MKGFRIRMRRRGRPALLAMVLGVAVVVPPVIARHGEDPTINVTVLNRQGEAIGRAAITDVRHGVLIEADIEHLGAGKHGFHFHETGRCDAPDFTSAGGHIDRHDATHGYLYGQKHHGGDMPNQIVPGSGRLVTSVFNGRLRLIDGADALIDDDGSALVIHAGADDYTSQPSGAAGPRVACAVIDAELLRKARRGEDAHASRAR